jgi:hypothetical protein
VSKFYIAHKITVGEDRRLAKALAAELEAMGHIAIHHAASDDPGANWREAHIKALVDSDAVVALLIKNHSDSVMGEIGMARVLQHARGKMLLLPVLVEIDIPNIVKDIFNFRMKLKPTREEIQGVVKELVRAVRRQPAYPNVFISHRHSDARVVRALVKVLETAFEIQPSNLRCTSVHPYRLKAGDRTAERLRRELQHAEAVLGLISPDVKDSSYVLFELGASWGRAGITFPLLIRGATTADVPAPIGDLHTLSLTEAAECHQLLDDLEDVVCLRRQTERQATIESRISDLINAARA